MYIRASSPRCGADLLPKCSWKGFQEAPRRKATTLQPCCSGRRTKTPKYLAGSVPEAPQERRALLLPCGGWGNELKSGDCQIWGCELTRYTRKLSLVFASSSWEAARSQKGVKRREEHRVRSAGCALPSYRAGVTGTAGGTPGFVRCFCFCAFDVFVLLLFPLLAALYHTNGFQCGFPIPSVTAQLSQAWCFLECFYPLPASITPFSTGHQAFAFLATFQARCFGLALNYSLKKTM